MSAQPNIAGRVIADNRSDVSSDTLGVLVDLGTHTEEALETLTGYGRELLSDLGTGFVPDAELNSWIANGGIEEQRDRYSTVRTLELFRVRAIDADPLPYPNLPTPADNPNLRRRWLQPVEIGLVRLSSLYRSDSHVSAIAVLDTGGTAGDYPGLGADRVVIVDAANQIGYFRLAGTNFVAERTNPIPPWAFDSVVAATNAYVKREQQLADRDQTDCFPSICTDSRKDANKVTSAALMIVKTVLDDTGIRQDATVKPESIRNTAGRRIWQADSLEAAAKALGVTDFNSLRKEIGAAPHRPVKTKWRPEPELRRLP